MGRMVTSVPGAQEDMLIFEKLSDLSEGKREGMGGVPGSL
jgi:hypothetical protein